MSYAQAQGIAVDAIPVIDLAGIASDTRAVGVAMLRAAEAGHVLASRTFSKLYGMAGLRLGWLVGVPALLEAVGKVGPTFPVSIPALAAGLAALEGEL